MRTNPGSSLVSSGSSKNISLKSWLQKSLELSSSKPSFSMSHMMSALLMILSSLEGGWKPTQPFLCVVGVIKYFDIQTDTFQELDQSWVEEWIDILRYCLPPTDWTRVCCRMLHYACTYAVCWSGSTKKLSMSCMIKGKLNQNQSLSNLHWSFDWHFNN